MESILIRGGRVIDPMNGVDRMTNVWIENGTVKCLADEMPDAVPEGATVISAEGMVVAPGFIDIHMHEDPYDGECDELDKSIARSMVLMGVTTAIGGNCGSNQLAPRLYLDLIDQKGTAVNVGLLAGHTFLRRACGGTDKYAPVTDDVLARMKEMGADCLAAGCFGISFGVKYVPGTTEKELTEMAALCSPKKHLAAAHVRRDVDGVFDAVKEMAELGKKLSIPIQISHIGSMGGYGQMAELLKQIAEYRKDGLDLKCDCYPYNAFSTGIGETTYDDGFLDSYQADYDSILICDGKYAGRRCTKEIFDELRREAPDTTTVGYFMKSDDVEMALLDSEIMIGSDGVRNKDQGHPRAAGTFPRVYAEYVRGGRLSLAEAVGKMTAMPAARLGLTQKGNLAPGVDGDVVIFNPETIGDRATYQQPALPPVGIEWVLIGGKTAVRAGVLVDDSLGRALRCDKG